MNKTFDCALIGEGSLLVRCADLLLERGHRITGIVSKNDAVGDWAQDNDIALIHPKDDVVSALGQQPFDYLLSIANLSIVKPDVLALPRLGAINFHDGPLPRYAGLYATTWALMNQEPEHGVTWHEMLEGVDDGAILKQQVFDVADDETAATLNVKCYNTAAESFAELMDELASGQVNQQAQNADERTYFAKYLRPAAAGTLFWNRPAAELAALARALDFGAYANELGLPRLMTDVQVALVSKITISDTESTADPGTITDLSAAGLQVATTTHDVIISDLMTVDGAALKPDELAAAGLRVGSRLDDLDAQSSEALTTLNEAIARKEAFWVRRLASLEALEAPYANRGQSDDEPGYETYTLAVPETLLRLADETTSLGDVLTAAFSLYLARVSSNYRFDIGFHDQALADTIAGYESLYAAHVPLRVNLQPEASAAETLQTVLDQVGKTRTRLTYARDVLARYPDLKALRGDQLAYSVVIEQVASLSDYQPQPGSDLNLVIADDGCQLVYQVPVLDAERVATIEAQFHLFAEHLTSSDPVAAISLLTEAERRLLLDDWNATGTAYDRAQCIHQQFEDRAAQSPDDIALVFENQTLTYGELNRRANQLAHYLRRLGVRPDDPVGLHVERSVDLVVALLGILKAGGAYVPLDPAYPQERIAYMIADAQVPVLVTQEQYFTGLPEHQAQVVCIDSDWPAIAYESDANVISGVRPDNLSYIIYTSGSTGKPKGVMVQHGNVINFFAGMDERVQHDPPGVWLAVTSLSFDISVLEIFWTLARGFKVVVYADQSRDVSDSVLSSLEHTDKTIDFSLFYFASDEGEHAEDKYNLLIEGAKFADQNGFVAVWTPERHFHAFGGLYPNPSVASAAVAMITNRIQLRAGSCVNPLHSPIRVAEEWALVDNLSKGRVGIAFAAGWQPNDFVLMPQNYDDRKNIMFRDIETIQRLWRGETLTFPGAKGDVEVRTLPRPIQPELPSWITAAGNPETFRKAGAGGFRVLTHLLGQTVDELAEKIAIYRQAWREAGHEGEGYISLMLHTYVGDDTDEAREIVREPMKGYLASAVDLVKKAAWHFPTIKQKTESGADFDMEELTPEESAAVLDYAFERYYETSGLFGTPETCIKLVDALKGVGVDDIACLIDYGVPSDMMMAQFGHLNRVRELANRPAPTAEEDYSIAAQIERHQVTHLQCTPSMASMLLEDPHNRAALGQLSQMMVGGEAFPVALAATLQEIVPGDVINMYGPTETTIWSSTHHLSGESDSIPIGRPIANTTIYLLDEHLQPVPVGAPGELWIGGDGVVRGYHNLPEMTAQRFVPDPFSSDPTARMYHTGDLARYRPDGCIEFLGRIDHQVKIRGYRIELGEIETALDDHDTISQAVVIAREDAPGDKRLVAYLLAETGATVDETALRSTLKARLPEFMVPSHFVAMDVFPLTPNKKVDRKALPAPDAVSQGPALTYVAPQGELEGQIVTIWQNILNLPHVGAEDNFFDLGGHSLLAVRMHRQVCEAIEREIPITDIFRFPTIKTLASHLSNGDQTDGAATGTNRADRRRDAIERRRQQRKQRNVAR